MIARDVMTREVACVQADTPLEEAIALMLERRVGGLPVVDGAGAVAGIVTEGDLLRRHEIGTGRPPPGWVQYLVDPGRAAQADAREHGGRVSDVMTLPPVTVAPEATLAEVVALMVRHRIRRLPVIEHGRLAGIVARADLLRPLLVALGRSRMASPEGGDASPAIRDGPTCIAARAPPDLPRGGSASAPCDTTLSDADGKRS